MKTTLAIIGIIVLAGVLYLLLRASPGAPPATSGTPDAGSGTPPASNVVVTYTDQGFSPKSVTVPLGATVTFMDQADGDMWVASAPHPSHQGYDGTTVAQHCAVRYSGAVPFDQCTPSASYSFTFQKTGTWNYHDHLNATNFGSVVVTAVP